MKKTSLGGLLIVLAGALVGCGAAVEDDEAVSLEDATYLTSLEANEDGSDEDAADVTEDGPQLFNGCALKGLKQSLINRFDANGDGTLDEEEKATLSEEFGGRPKHFLNRWRHSRKHRLMLFKWVYDVDQSGDLSDAERGELESDLTARCEAKKALFLEKFDADGNGTFSDEEWVAIHDAIKARWAERRAKLLLEFDTNGDGRLDQDERQAAREAIKEKMQARREALKAEYDTNGDGKLDDDERAALREYLRERVRGEHWGEGG